VKIISYTYEFVSGWLMTSLWQA